LLSGDKERTAMTNQRAGSGRRFTAVLRLAGGGALLAYDLVLRPWMREWGSTAEERASTLPGDEVVSDVMAHYTKALTIDAPPEAVWPWLVQIGDRRAGFYSYDWVERLAFGTVHYVERTHSANRIHPELQHPRIGERLNTASFGKVEVGNPITVLEPNRAIVAGWAFVLEPLPGSRTRLLLRDRDDGYTVHMVSRSHVLPRLVLGAADYLIGDPLHFLMERKMMLGLKERAESTWAGTASASP
jgi:hypothetical protein